MILMMLTRQVIYLVAISPSKQLQLLPPADMDENTETLTRKRFASRSWSSPVISKKPRGSSGALHAPKPAVFHTLGRGSPSTSAGTSRSDAPPAACLTMYHYCDKASSWIEDFDNSELMLILLEHTAKPSLFFNLKENFAQFLVAEKLTLDREAAAGDEAAAEAASAWPADTEALHRTGVTFRFRGTTDSQHVGATYWQK